MSKMSDMSINTVITATKSWPGFDVGSKISGIVVLLDESVIVLDQDKNSMLKFQLNKKGKYEVVTRSVKGFTTQPFGLCSNEEPTSSSNSYLRLAVLERTKEMGTILFTCSDSFGEKEYLGFLKDSSFVIKYNWTTGMYFIGMARGNILVVDPAVCRGKSQNDELVFSQTITVDG